MNATIQYIETELSGYYPESEIKGMVRLIMENVCGWSYTDLIISRNKDVDAEQKAKIREITERLKTFEPIQYIFGETEFYGLKIGVNPAVLIPRQETEELVEWIVGSVALNKPKILDIGTGSGCIALALKKAVPGAQVTGIDVSDEALQTAVQNAKRNNLEVNFLNADILNYQEKSWEFFDVVVSNPPYVKEEEKKHMLPNVLNYEPGNALFVPDTDPLLFYRAIAGFAQQQLRKNGWLFFEINENLPDEMIELCSSFGFHEIKIRQDINGKPRMLRCKKKN